MKQRYGVWLVALFLVGCYAPSCASKHSNSVTDSVEAVGNPASQFCVDHGGTLGIYKTPDGEVGYCDVQGGLVEEWTLYRAVKQSSEQKAIAVYLSHPAKAGNSVGNPASSYCVQVGGDNKMVTSSLGQMGICEFSDHSAIDEWTLFNGPAAKANSALNTLLGRDRRSMN